MDTVTLGRTGLEVSVVGLGCGGKSRLGQGTGSSIEESVKLVHDALDLGINYIDTKRLRGIDSIVGMAIKDRRDDAIISTKAHIRGRNRNFANGDEERLSVAAVRTLVEESFRELQTDMIDVFHIQGVNNEDYDYAINEVYPEIARFRDAGAIRFLAISERNVADPEHVMLERAIADDLFDVILVGFNFFNPSARKVVVPAAEAHNLGITLMCAVDSVMRDPQALSAMFARLVADGSIAASDVDLDHPLDFLTEDGAASSIVDAAYRYARHESGAHVILTGTGNIDHLRQNVDAINGSPLPAETVARLNALFGDLALAPTA
jgi:L-galactose dehydrogenase